MRKFLSSLAMKVAALLIGYVAALSSAMVVSGTFNYYLSRFIIWLRMDLIVSIPIFIGCMSLLAYSIWITKGSKPPIWRGADLLTLAVITYCAIFTGRYATRIYAPRIYPSSLLMLMLSAATYAIAAAFFTEVVARVRDRQLGLYWLRFFQSYPPFRQLIGFAMAALLTCNLFYAVVVFPVAALQLRLNAPQLLISLFSVAALTYFCAFALSLSAEYGKASAEKIRAEKLKTELITNVSHDIRTPLTAIISYVGLLKALPVDNKEFAEYVGVLDKKTGRLKSLVDDLMEASASGAMDMGVGSNAGNGTGTGASTGANADAYIADMDLMEIIGQVAGEFDDQFAERSLTLVPRQPGTLVLAIADGKRLRRVLENLFSNAAKYAMPGTRVFAEISVTEGKPVFSLKNMSAAPLDTPGDDLTEQFMRGDRSRHTEGNGLGLYIAKNYMESMGGRLSIAITGDMFEAKLLFV